MNTNALAAGELRGLNTPLVMLLPWKLLLLTILITIIY